MASLGILYRPLRRRFHRLLSAARGGRGVRVRVPAAAGASAWTIAAAPAAYEDLRYWLDYEGATVALLRRLWRPGLSVLDVGAHHGLFSLCCCAPATPPARLVAVEPSPAALPLLRANFAVLRKLHPALDGSIVVAAVGESEGVLRMHTGYLHMLVAEPGLHHGDGVSGDPVEVRLTTLDALVRHLGMHPDIVKLDVEGYEAEALRGARNLLALRPRPPIIILEWHWDLLGQRGHDPLDALAPLAQAGYRFEPYEFPDWGPVELPALAALPRQEVHRLFCRPPDGAASR